MLERDLGMEYSKEYEEMIREGNGPTDRPLMINIYAVRDNKAMLFMQPVMFLENDSVALRTFIELCQNPQSMFNRFPDDYSLCWIGCFEQRTATFYDEDPFGNCSAFVVAEAKDYVVKEDENEVQESVRTEDAGKEDL